MVTALIFCFSACGNKNNTTSTTSNMSDTVSLPNKIITIGNTTVKEIATKLIDIKFDNELKLSIEVDSLNAEQSAISYFIVDANNKHLAQISMFSDLENKAAQFTISWEYKNNTSDINEQLLEATKAILPAVWPEYSQSNYEALERNFKLTTDYIDRFVDTNTSESAPASGDSGFISLSTSSGVVIFSIRYPNLVENV